MDLTDYKQVSSPQIMSESLCQYQARTKQQLMVVSFPASRRVLWEPYNQIRVPSRNHLVTEKVNIEPLYRPQDGTFRPQLHEGLGISPEFSSSGVIAIQVILDAILSSIQTSNNMD